MAALPRAESAATLDDVIEGLPEAEDAAVCIPPARAQELLAPIASAHRARRLGFTVEFELDGGADVAAALGGRSTSLTPVLAASRALRRSGVRVRWLVPLQDALVHRLEALFSLAQDETVDALLLPAPALGPDENRFARDFIAYRLLEEDAHRFPPARLAFYRALLAAPDGTGLPMASRTLVRFEAAQDRWTIAREVRPELTGDRPRPRLAPPVLQALDVAGVLLEGQRALLQWLGALAAARPPERRLGRVLLIGAYGGEHIGDATILGGVLLRLHERYGTTDALLVSQRPEHTRRLARMLDTPVEVRVDLYEQSRVGRYLAEADGVVFAGGPLTDLPKQLVKHLYTAALARRRDLPFIVEGIGAGPFVRRASAWTGRRVLRLAQRIAVRTAADAQAPVVRDLAPEVGRDPAFDYLEARPVPIARLPDADRRWIEALLADTQGRLRVGLNLRPIRDLYTVGVPARRRAAHTRAIEARFEQQVADGLRRFQATQPAPPCFVFFPMNAIQFGSSDLRSAYRLGRLLGDAVDLRIWQGDPCIDGVVALLRQLDIVVAMRFHAAIYALSQGRKVIGIDYRIGRRDKVAALLADFGQAGNCARIDQLTAGWLAERLSALATQPLHAPAPRRPGPRDK